MIIITKLWRFIKGVFLSIWELIKSFFKSYKGLIALFISFSIFVGWALAFIVIGFVSKNYWFTGIGTTVVMFWAAPITPMWGFIVVTAYCIQRFIFRDRFSLTWAEVKQIYLKSLRGE